MSEKYYPDRRFEVPKQGKPVENPYDIDSAILQDQIQRNIAPVVCYLRVDLTTAGQREFLIPGTALVVYGNDGSATKTVNTTAYVEAFFDNMDASAGNGFPMKHARGFRGPFAKFVLKWPAQNGVYIDIVVHRYKGLQWVDGESAT